jgi:hypothetical protein
MECELLRHFYLKLKEEDRPGVPSDFNNPSEKDCINLLTGRFNDKKSEIKSLQCESKWIFDDLEELTALAQHYGIPTRMLDWTYDFDTALYFASINVAKKVVGKSNAE